MAIYPDAYQYERAEHFGVKTIGQALKKLNVTYKKALTRPKVNVGKRRYFQQQIVGHSADESLILMKVVLPMICRVPMDTRNVANGVMAFWGLASQEGE